MIFRNSFFLASVGLFLFNYGNAFNITFRVDMNNVTANFNTAQVNGTFNNWCGACFSLTDADGDNIWVGTTNLNAGSYQYKFTYDNWAGQETLTAGSPCTVTSGTFTNRTLVVTGDAVLPVVCWNSCVSCAETPPPPVFYSVTFSLDMSQQSGFGTPEVNGIFNNWCGNCFPMIDSNNDSIYTATTTLQEGSYEYKFSYSNWAGQETLVAGSPCTQTTDIYTNRILQLSSDTVLSPVCWGSCYGCGMEPQEYNVTFRVDMSEQSGFSIPEVNGTFNGWCGSCNPMTDADNDSIWELTVPLIEGMIEYKFSYDNWLGQETLDSGAFCTITSDGYTNRYLNLISDTVLDLVCFGSCNACGYMPPPSYNVTFLVDMSQESGFNSVELNGSFNNYCGDCLPLADSVGSGIWSVTVTLQEGNYTYFYSTDSLSDVENLDPSFNCAISVDSNYYRSITVYSDTVLPLVCWENCTLCPLPPALYDVTFQVDMSQQEGFSVVEINGTFNNFCGNCNPLSDTTGNGIWDVTLSLPAGIYSYHYSADSLMFSESLDAQDPCLLNLNSNLLRYIIVTSDTVLPLVCWGTCNQCETAPTLYNVTFQVDMSQQSNFISPEINGSFNDFCGNCNPLSDTTGNGIWDVTLSLPAGIYTYYYSADSLMLSEDLDSDDLCVLNLDNSLYRYIIVSSDTILPAVCWGACNQCVAAPSLYNVTFQVDMSQQSNFITPEINGPLNDFCGNCNSLTDVNNDSIWEGTLSLLAGNYIYFFSTDSLSNIEDLDSAQCAVLNDSNAYRLISVSADTIIPPVCWAECHSCGNIDTISDTLYTVKFQVDMSQQIGYTIPEINGSFNDFCGNCNPLSDTTGNGIWEVTLSLHAGVYTYYYSADSLAISEGLGPDDLCALTIDSSLVRYIIVDSDSVLPIVCWGACNQCEAPVTNYDVTFQLDMSQQSGYTTPEINGSFNDFCGNCNPLSDTNGNGIWDVTLSLPAGIYTYYYSADSLMLLEGLSSDDLCALTIDSSLYRYIIVSADTILPIVCWGACNQCEAPVPNYDVTFQLDMSEQSGFTAPEINGSFNDFCGNCNPLLDTTGNGIWEITLSLPAGIYTYYYSADSLMLSEVLDSDDLCALTIDSSLYRYIIVSADTILPIVCWGACNQCEVTPAFYDVTFQLDLSTQNNLSSPEINGSFNANCGNCNALSDSDNNGIWEITLSLPAGIHSYYYSNDSLALIESLNSSDLCVFNLNSIYYRQLQLSSDTVLPVVCWGSCSQCPLTPASYSVTFRLDMSQQTGFTSPEVNGTFNNWCGNCFPMSDLDGDNIWEATTQLDMGTFEYKFSYDNWTGQEQLIEGSPCTVTNDGYTNRNLQLNSDTLLPVVCWSACTTCDSTPPPMTRTVTFRVDMSQQTGFTTPEVNGTFNNWCGSCFPMTDANGDNIWEATTTLPIGVYEYKFSNDNWSGSEQLIPGSICTVTNSGFTNRILNLDTDTILNVVCWSSCTSCDSTPPMYSVTFRVDMSQQTGFITPEVNGTFNNWCGSCFSMSDTNGDNIWEATTTLAAGDYQYKFSNDNWTGQESLTPGSICTFTDGTYTNRYLELSSDTILPEVCWGSCSVCELAQPVSVQFVVDVSGQSFTDNVIIAGNFNNYCNTCDTLMPMGGGLYSGVFNLLPGVYDYYFGLDDGAVLESLSDAPCTVAADSSFHRAITVTEATILPEVCWNACDTCEVNTSIHQVNENRFVVFPNPANDNVNLRLTTQEVTRVELRHISGALVHSCAYNTSLITLPTASLSQGVYVISVSNDAGTERQVIQIIH